MCSSYFLLSNRGRGWQRFNVACHQEPSTGTSISIPPGGGLDISLGGEVRRGPSYPDPV